MNNTSYSAFPQTIIGTKIVMYSLVLAWSLISNFLVVAVILKNKHLQNNFNYLIMNMAISDLIIPCVGLPINIAAVTLRPYEWLVDGPFGTALCKLGHFVADISPAVSAFSLVIIAANRYMAIAYPMKIKLTKSRTIKLNCATWVMAFLLLSPHLYTFRLEGSHGWLMCINSWAPAFDDETAETIFISIVLVVVFVIPGVTNTCLYSVMLYKLRQNSKNIALMLNNKQTRRRQHKDKNIFIMTLSVMVSYLLLWGPFYCAVFVLTFTAKDNSVNSEIVTVAITTVQFLGYLHSAINPCIYFIFLKSLRQGLVNMLCQRGFKGVMESSLQTRLSHFSPTSFQKRRQMKSSSL